MAGTDQFIDRGTISDKSGNSWRNCSFPARFSSTTTIAKVPGVIYSLPGRVDVGTDQGAASTNTVATLNIDAGVVIFASTGNAYLAVNRGNKRSEEHTYELQSLMRISYAVFCLKKKNNNNKKRHINYN